MSRYKYILKCDVEIELLQRGTVRRIFDYMKHGIPEHRPDGGYYNWLKKNNPEMLS